MTTTNSLPDDNVPDEIYLALARAKTPEEWHFKIALVFHRCSLNGGLVHGFDVTFHDHSLAELLTAYGSFGLEAFADIIREAAPVHEYLNTLDDAAWDALTTDPMEPLDQKYLALCYRNDEPADHMELPVLAFIRANPEKFANLLSTP